MSGHPAYPESIWEGFQETVAPELNPKEQEGGSPMKEVGNNCVPVGFGLRERPGADPT